MASYLITVTGLVQGVGFRWATKKIAEAYHITGWIRNDPSGTVVIRAQGIISHLESFLATVKRGPTPFARIDQLEVTPQPIEDFNQFVITN